MPAALETAQRNRLREWIQELAARHPGDPKRKQSVVAAQLGVTPSAINRLVNGDTGGSRDMIDRAAKLLNRDPEWVLTGDRSKRAIPSLRELDGWEEARADALRRSREDSLRISLAAVEMAGDYRVSPVPPKATATIVLAFAGIAQKQIDDPSPPSARITRR